jgi:hypothetical protein
VLGFLVARPLIAIGLAVVVVVGVMVLGSRGHTTPVTHRKQHVALTVQPQMELAAQTN